MNLIGKLSIAKKLISVFVILSLIWCSLCGISFKLMLDIKASYSLLLNQQATTLAKTKEIQFHVANQSYALLAYMQAIGAGALGDMKSKQLLDNSTEQINVLIAETMGLLKNPEDQKILKSIDDSNKLFMQKANEVINTVETNRVKAEVIMQNEVSNLSLLIISNANEIADNQQKLMIQKEAEIDKQTRKVMQTILVISSVVFVASIVMGYFVARRMSKPIAQMVSHTAQIASGNLRIQHWQATSGDEIGRLSIYFRHMTENLRELIERIASSSNKIGSSITQWQRSAGDTTLASHHIAEIMQDVQSAVFEQMHSIGLTNQSAAEMSNGIQQITRNAYQTALKANEILELSHKGTKEMNHTAQQMNAIRNSVRSLQQTIQVLSLKTAHIGNIVELISGIAKQTNVLALNASIEAARAGIQGRGFAVIAEQVRTLSIQTASSASEISQSIEEIIIDSKMTSYSVENSILEVEQGMQAVERADTTFSAIQEAIGDFSHDIQEISSASLLIESLSKSVVQAIEHINQMSLTTSDKTQEASAATEEQLASMEEIMDSVKDLADLASGLHATTHNFKW